MPSIESPHRAATRQLTIAYVSALIILTGLLVTKQIIIQLALQSEVATHARASVINGVELRSQRLLRDSLLLFTPGNHVATLAEMHRDEPAWEEAQFALYNGSDKLDIHPSDLTSDSRTRLDREKDDFLAMREALLHLLALTSHTYITKSIAPDVTTIFYKQVAYLPSVIYAYQELDTQADQRVHQVQLIEIILFTLATGTLVGEFLLVVRPALVRLRHPFVEDTVQ